MSPSPKALAVLHLASVAKQSECCQLGGLPLGRGRVNREISVKMPLAQAVCGSYILRSF